VFACVGWQVTLCDPIWQVTPKVLSWGFSLRTYHGSNFSYCRPLSQLACNAVHFEQDTFVLQFGAEMSTTFRH